MDFVLSLMKLLLGEGIELLSLGEVKLKLGGFTLTLDTHVLFPVLDALGQPLLHETCVSLEFVDLDAAHFLFALSVLNHVLVVKLGSLSGLAHCFVIELLLMRFKVDIFLGAVQLAQPLLEEVVGNVVILGLAHRDALRWLVISESARFGYDGDISGWVDLLEDHFELVEKAERLAPLPVHNLLNSLAVELHVEAPQRRLQLLKVHHEVRGRIPTVIVSNQCDTYFVEKLWKSDCWLNLYSSSPKR